MIQCADPKMKRVYETAESVAVSRASILITVKVVRVRNCWRVLFTPKVPVPIAASSLLTVPLFQRVFSKVNCLAMSEALLRELISVNKESLSRP